MKQIIKIILLLLSFTTFNACIKVDDDLDANPGNLQVKEGKWTQITNLKLDREASNKNFYFNLDTGKQVSENDEFDFILDTYYYEKNFIINRDYKTPCPDPECSGLMVGTLVAEDFEKVTEAPDPKNYPYNRVLNEDGTRIEGNDRDWVIVFWEQQRRGNLRWIGFYYPVIGILEKGQAEGSGNYVAQIIQKRTFILRTKKGNWAKVQIQGIYKDAPLEPTSESEPGYLTFRYYVQKDGSRNLDTR